MKTMCSAVIRPMLRLRNLSTLCVVDHLWSRMYILHCLYTCQESLTFVIMVYIIIVIITIILLYTTLPVLGGEFSK